MTRVDARRVFVVWGLVAGGVLRMAIHATALGRPDADEVVSALMVRHLGDTGVPLFVWGQHYGGTAQLLPVAASMGIFGDNLLGLRLPNVVLAAVSAWLLYRIARRSMDDRWATLAGVLLWVAPAATVWFGIHEQLFYPPTTAMGLGLVLVAHRMVESPGRLPDAAWFGLLAGVGWWTSTNIVYFAVPAAWILLRRPRLTGSVAPHWGQDGVLSVRRLVTIAAFAVVGASPWLVDLVASDGAPLRSTEHFPRLGSFPLRIAYLFREAFSGTVGARDVLSHDWAWGPVGIGIAVGVYAVLGIGLWQGVKARSWDAVGFGWFVVVYGAIGWSPDDPNLRYTFAAAPFLVMLAVRGVAWLSERGRPVVLDDRRWLRVAVLTLVVATALSTVSMVRLHDLSENGGTVYRVGNVPDLDEVIAVLEREGVDRVWSDYWVAYRLVFETDGQVISSPAAGIVRYDPYAEQVSRADRVAWVALRDVQSDALIEAMVRLGVPFQQFDTEHFVVVIPDRPVRPDELPEAARRAPQTPRPDL